jgi:hypothetical protein
MDRNSIFNRAIPFFTAKKYQLQTQTDAIVTFQSEEREVNWVVLIVFCCLGLILAIVYYFVFCQKHQVILSFNVLSDNQVTATGNTEQAKKDAQEFIMLLSTPVHEGINCSLCGTPVPAGKKFCSNCGNRIE